jgi:hypothetical protein
MVTVRADKWIAGCITHVIGEYPPDSIAFLEAIPTQSTAKVCLVASPGKLEMLLGNGKRFLISEAHLSLLVINNATSHAHHPSDVIHGLGHIVCPAIGQRDATACTMVVDATDIGSTDYNLCAICCGKLKHLYPL